MRALILLLLTQPLLGCQATPRSTAPAPAPHVAAVDPFAVVREVDRLAERDLWPGFDPRQIPFAIYDGERTLLFRHPAPPEGFAPLPDTSAVWAFPGRHPSVTANSSVELAGTGTATLMPAAAPTPLRAHAATLIHEAFHVFQRRNHPSWSANEVELFTYPVDDPGLLSLRRLETEALRRALAANEMDAAACWAQNAITLRNERFATLTQGAAAYERMSELNEGLAEYVERRAAGNAGSPLPSEDFPPEAVRARAYRSGAALALLLDRFSPGWRATLAQNDTLPLDRLLADALRTADARAACSFATTDRERSRAAAAADIERLHARRAEQKRFFLTQPGWTLAVASPTAPLFPQRFDPLNVQLVAPGEVLHTRFVRLGNDAGHIEVLGRPALTEAAGAHPLFNGVRAVTLAGFAEEPQLSEADGTVRIAIDGVTAELRGVVERGDRTIVVRLVPDAGRVDPDATAAASQNVLENEDVVHGSGEQTGSTRESLARFLAAFPERSLPYHLDDETNPGPARLPEISAELVDRHLRPASDFAAPEQPSRYYAVARFPAANDFTLVVYLENLHETRAGGGHLYHLATLSTETGQLVSRVFFYGFRAVQEGRMRTQQHAVFGVADSDSSAASLRQTIVTNPATRLMQVEQTERRSYQILPGGRVRTVRLRRFRPLSEMPGQNPNMAQVDVFDGPDAVEWEHREIASLFVEDLDGGADSIRAHLVALAKEIGADGVVIQRVYATSPGAYAGAGTALVYLDEQHRWYWRYRQR